MDTGTAPHRALERFTILQELSSHGRHRTMLARSKAGSLVTIEVLTDKPIPEAIGSALSREGSLAARLDHDAVVRSKALLLEPDFAALVSEFVPGVSLQRLLRFASGRGVRLPDDVAWYVVSGVLSALVQAHAGKDAAGNPSPIVHGGVSPGAIVVGWDGSTKLGDFGGRRIRALVSPLVGATAPSDLLHPVAPEEARGDQASASSDVFCAALVAWRLATGRTPYARLRDSASERMIAMSEGDLGSFDKVRPDLPASVREAFDRALEPDPAKRTITAQQLLESMKGAFQIELGQKALAKLLQRWRDGLDKSVTPWEKRASISDAMPPTSEDGVAPGTLALASEDDRPSGDLLVGSMVDSDPLLESAPSAEAPLAPTGVDASLSRLGAAVPEALTMPLPAMRMTMPSLPVYGGPPVNVPLPPPKPTFSGPVAAISVIAVFVLLVIAAIMLFGYLARPLAP